MSYTLPDTVTRWGSIINQVAAEQSVPASLIAAIIDVESSGNPNDVSSTGAVGLMQLMPGTAAEVGCTDRYDPLQNVRGGTKYIKNMLNMFNNDVAKSLTAYYAGPGNVQKYGIRSDWAFYSQRVLSRSDNQFSGSNPQNVTDINGTAARATGNTLESSGSNETIQVFVAESEKNIKRWGILQYFEQIDTPSLGQNKADALLKIYNRKTRSLTIRDAFGNPKTRGGSMIPVQLDLGDYIANSYFIVDKVVHKFSKDSYTMDVTVEGAYDE